MELGADISDLATSLTYLIWLMHQIWTGDSMDPAYSLEVRLCVSCCNTGKGEFSSEKQKQVTVLVPEPSSTRRARLVSELE